MKIKKSILKKIIREEAGQLLEGCPVNLPCPYAAADELRASGASPEELLNWVATLTQELVSPTGTAQADAEGVPGTLDVDAGSAVPAMEIALERRTRRGKKLSSRQVRSIIESVVGPGELLRPPSKPVLPRKKNASRKNSRSRAPRKKWS